ncbi:MAG: FecR domain-containing protein [Pontiellaceae bacterium]|nr:FecR domain-containing protein [Pontiellaceae bacterium]MBN2784618.1 FecR domain-containing protein [Pontiellaceae bacterium]
MKMMMTMLGLLLSVTFCGAEPIGMVVAIQGKATATDSSGTERALAMKSDIMLNDAIKTDVESRIQLMMLDDSLVSLGASSEMTIDEYVYNPASASDNAFGAKLGKGVFRTVTGKITDMNPDRFKVKTRRATIGIRGCDLGFDTTGDKEDKVAVMAIPAGKKIFITDLINNKTLLVEKPMFVTIDNAGLMLQRPLTGANRQQMQQGTTPNAGTPDSGDGTLDTGSEELLNETGTLTQETFTPTVDSTDVTDTAAGEGGFQEPFTGP